MEEKEQPKKWGRDDCPTCGSTEILIQTAMSGAEPGETPIVSGAISSTMLVNPNDISILLANVVPVLIQHMATCSKCFTCYCHSAEIVNRPIKVTRMEGPKVV